MNFISFSGNLLLALSLLTTCVSIGFSIGGIWAKKANWLSSSTYVCYLTTGLLSLASCIMLIALASNDFSIQYVQSNIEVSMKWYYKLTAFWGGLDGSLLFWVFLLSLFSSIAIWKNEQKHPELLPYVTAILMSILFFFLLIVVIYKRPFAITLPFPSWQGKGMNPLLRDFYMIVHPPSLYIGYISASIPFAFGIASLITKTTDGAWLRSTRFWMLLSWYFLSQGLALGSLWAYHVLGWGGFWGWDPVENAGLLPWLTATAFLHSLIVQERRGMMRIWNHILLISTFVLTLVGTFLTRSGVVESAHAFGSDYALKMAFLIFIGFVTIASLGLLVYRYPLLRSSRRLESLASREFAFLVNNWLFLGAAFFLIFATLFPTLSEWIYHQRITVGVPFFSKWMTPIGLLILLSMGAVPFVSWKKTSLRHYVKQIALPILIAILLTFLLFYSFPTMQKKSAFFSDRLQLPIGLLCAGISLFAIAGVLQEFYIGILARKQSTQESAWIAFLQIIFRNKRRYVGYLIHVGVAILFIGFGGQAYKQEKDFTLKPNQEVSFQRYFIQYKLYEQIEDAEKTKLHANFLLWEKDHPEKKFSLSPAKWFYHEQEQTPRSIIATHSNLTEEVYMILNGIDFSLKPSEASVNIRVTLNPLIHWVWAGFAWILLGALLALLPDFFSLTTRKYGSSKNLLFLGILFLGTTTIPAKTTLASNPQKSESHIEVQGFIPSARSSLEEKIFRSLICMCGCPRQTLYDCACQNSAQERTKIMQAIDHGKKEDEIIKDYISRFPGKSALNEPTQPGANLAWILPGLSFLLVSAGFFIWHLKNKPRKPTFVQPNPIQNFEEPWEKKIISLDLTLEEEGGSHAKA